MTFISFHDISGKKDYMAGGKINVQAGSEKYCIEHGGVALHPNDRAMEIYADRIMKAWRRHGMLNESEVASGEKIILHGRMAEIWRVCTRQA